MFYVERFMQSSVIKSTMDEEFIFGPFESEADAEFVAQMFRMNKIIFNKGEEHGQESTEDTDTVHEHA